jgi:hypothetical protein
MSEIISLLWVDHPEMSKDWYEHEKSRMAEDDFAREIEINYSKSAKGIVFKEFKDAHILRGKFKPNAYKSIIRFLDYGKTCAAVFSQKDGFGGITFFHEIVLINESDPTNKLGRAVQSYSAELQCQGFNDHDDPAGTTDNYVNENETSFKIVQKYDIYPTHNVQGASNARRRNRVELTKHMLAQFPEGKPLIRVHESCTYLIDALQSGYRYKEDSKTKEILDEILEEHPHEDLADCFGGTLAEEFTVDTGIEIPARQIRRGNRYTGR